ncbi:putative vacuolar transporter chaperone [Trichodelitschia bisporula]|uniref:Vacuolar transporter chaperone complex subunit 4 n=1 Tax=Trichodelitschia bisporula TaxID=703511 RepID=A0A6G1I2S7_9PEZI|nr:putative vacuolar transporter chaperone [Trichodelitschia bisporula]
MRFGHQLKTSLIQNWYFHYIDYDSLKDALKTDYATQPTSETPKPKRKAWTEDDERRFVKLLEAELDKVFTFQKVKSQEIVKRIRASEQEVTEVVSKADRAAQEGQQAPDEEDFILLEEDLSDIIADVHDLAKFTQLNYTGFQKIIKKHDKQTDWHLKPVFAARLRAKPFFKDNYDAFIVKLSKLYDLVRTRGNPIKGDSSAGGGQQNFVRQTTKYWVHPDNITEVKLIILKHLPVLVFNASKEFDAADTAISSIYYDNVDTWELYTGRLKKTEGAEAIRLRWYGGMNTETIFVERKTHREDWTGEKSVKARFAIKEKNVNAFLSGQMTVDQVFERMRRDGKKSEKEIADLEQLAREIQYRVITRKLVPVTRSFYHRTAFQLPGDARVRISLDTELTMIREDNLDGRQRAGKNWRRMDIGIDFPFSQLPPEDVERFPYAVLEVKLQTQAGQQPPEWIRELTASHLVEAVPKFSKFIHGTAVLNPARIDLLPFWTPQMDVDIRKPVSHRFGIERPTQSGDISTGSENIDEDTDDEGLLTLPPAPLDDDNDDNVNIRRLRAARDALEEHDAQQRRDFANGAAGNSLDIEERVGAARALAPDDDYPIYDSESEDDDFEEARRVGGWPYARARAKRSARVAANAIWNGLLFVAPRPRATEMPPEEERVGGSKRVGEVKRFKAPRGKRIHVPVRIEPKVSLATERTFLAWLEFSIILGSIAAALINFGDAVSLASAIGFTVVGVVAIGYSLALYLWRVDKTRKRRAVVYHDKWGPSVLCVMLLAAVAVNLGLRFGGMGSGIGFKG